MSQTIKIEYFQEWEKWCYKLPFSESKDDLNTIIALLNSILIQKVKKPKIKGDQIVVWFNKMHFSWKLLVFYYIWKLEKSKLQTECASL